MTTLNALGPLAALAASPAAETRPDALAPDGEFDALLAGEARATDRAPGAPDRDAAPAAGPARTRAAEATDEPADAPEDTASDASATDEAAVPTDPSPILAAAVAAEVRAAAPAPAAGEPAQDAPTAASRRGEVVPAIVPPPAPNAAEAATPEAVTPDAAPTPVTAAPVAAPAAAGPTATATPTPSAVGAPTPPPSPAEPRRTPAKDTSVARRPSADAPGEGKDVEPADAADGTPPASPPAADASVTQIVAPHATSPAAPVAGSTAAPVEAPAPFAGPASLDPAVAQALARIRTTVEAGVPGLESRIDDPRLGAIRVLVSGRPGETVRAELVARDPAAARELSVALDRALASGAQLPAGVDLRVRAEGAARPAAPEQRQAAGDQPNDDARHGRHAAADHQSPSDRREQPGAGSFETALGTERGDRRASTPHPQPGRERRPASVPAVPATATRAARSGAALDVRA